MHFYSTLYGGSNQVPTTRLLSFIKFWGTFIKQFIYIFFLQTLLSLEKYVIIQKCQICIFMYYFTSFFAGIGYPIPAKNEVK